jgi:hypothetical protein
VLLKGRNVERAGLLSTQRGEELGRLRQRRWGGARSRCRLLLLRAGHRLAHLVGQGEAHTHAAGGHPARVLGRVFHGVGRLVLRVLVQIADDAHAGAFVERGLDGLGQRDVLDEHAGQLDPVVVEVALDPAGDEGAQLVVVGGHIQHGDLALADHVGEARDDEVAQLVADLVGGEVPVGADDLPDELAGIGDFDDVAAERAEPDRPELGVAKRSRAVRDRDRRRGSMGKPVARPTGRCGRCRGR